MTQDTLKLLKRIYRNSKYYQVRQRAHCIQLSYQGYSSAELIRIFEVSRNTIYNWFNAWESSRFAGLYNHPGRGRKKILNVNQEQQIKKWVKETPKNREKVQERIEKEGEITISKK
ncbi:helix-turn-helix domain-containing protein [Hyella patelloides]|uniref:helix-turn-helix domain-containing protein n=1 Tax=Hyella patelloides TaxID=1982969 RepID=UPI001FE7DEF6|nr:helix-turn-helix domain-containing protein [Hyella patelloides]